MNDANRELDALLGGEDGDSPIRFAEQERPRKVAGPIERLRQLVLAVARDEPLEVYESEAELSGLYDKALEAARTEGRQQAVREIADTLTDHSDHLPITSDGENLRCSPDDAVLVAGLNASESPHRAGCLLPDQAHAACPTGDASESPPTHGITDPNAPPGWKCGDPLCRWHGTQSAFTRGDASESPPTGPPDPLCPTCDAKGAVIVAHKRDCPNAEDGDYPRSWPLPVGDASESPPPLDVERIDTAMQYAIAYMNDPEGLAARREEWRDRLRDALHYLRGDAEYEIDAGDGKTYRFSGDASESPPPEPINYSDPRWQGNYVAGDASESGQPPRHMHGWGEICDSECPAWLGQPPEARS